MPKNSIVQQEMLHAEKLVRNRKLDDERKAIWAEFLKALDPEQRRWFAAWNSAARALSIDELADSLSPCSGILSTIEAIVKEWGERANTWLTEAKKHDSGFGTRHPFDLNDGEFLVARWADRIVSESGLITILQRLIETSIAMDHIPKQALKLLAAIAGGLDHGQLCELFHAWREFAFLEGLSGALAISAVPFSSKDHVEMIAQPSSPTELEIARTIYRVSLTNFGINFKEDFITMKLNPVGAFSGENPLLAREKRIKAVQNILPDLETLAQEFSDELEQVRKSLNEMIESHPSQWQEKLWDSGPLLNPMLPVNWPETERETVLIRCGGLEMARAASIRERNSFDCTFQAMKNVPETKIIFTSEGRKRHLPDLAGYLMNSRKNATLIDFKRKAFELLTRSLLPKDSSFLQLARDSGVTLSPILEDFLALCFIDCDPGFVDTMRPESELNGLLAPLGFRSSCSNQEFQKNSPKGPSDTSRSIPSSRKVNNDEKVRLLPAIVKNWLTAKYLADTDGWDCKMPGMESAERLVPITIQEMTAFLLENHIPILPNLDDWENAGYILDFKLELSETDSATTQLPACFNRFNLTCNKSTHRLVLIRPTVLIARIEASLVSNSPAIVAPSSKINESVTDRLIRSKSGSSEHIQKLRLILDDKSIGLNEKLIAAESADLIQFGDTSTQLTEIFGVSDSAVRQTKWWKASTGERPNISPKRRKRSTIEKRDK